MAFREHPRETGKQGWAREISNIPQVADRGGAVKCLPSLPPGPDQLQAALEDGTYVDGGHLP